MEPLVADLVDVHAEGARAIAAVGADQWSLPTPCEDWDVADLVRHQVMGHRVFTALLAGEPVDRATMWGELGEVDPAQLTTLFVESARDLERAFDAPEALARRITLPIGEVPAEASLHLRLAETMVHGWDLARATGQQPHFPDDLVEREIEASRQLLQRVPAGHSPFGSPVGVPDDAAPLDRLAALLGRTP
ncbi:TIGR03086 family protein [Nocardioides mangrovicus]|uniref:TIGR03086 family protein n=1 Tax=Nocardioides mangrovicus TaxID=2478913 RepID=A0A3L8NWQ5_9ACTN|nr:TIGR03086 family metal-binding protein [Nocardioides mangrovicus]RLV47580.1 TIGR03086 family protein [Nocardioides mangrovicus]